LTLAGRLRAKIAHSSDAFSFLPCLWSLQRPHPLISGQFPCWQTVWPGYPHRARQGQNVHYRRCFPIFSLPLWALEHKSSIVGPVSVPRGHYAGLTRQGCLRAKVAGRRSFLGRRTLVRSVRLDGNSKKFQIDNGSLNGWWVGSSKGLAVDGCTSWGEGHHFAWGERFCS
jgi:hypothetical protein